MGSQSRLSAEYCDFSGTTPFSHDLTSLPPNHSTEAKTAYLSSLRTAVTKLQNEVNVFLTKKMEMEKQVPNKLASSVDDAKEEENYGEEVLDEA